MDEEKEYLMMSRYQMRRVIGVLGLFLPVVIIPFHEHYLNSISHYYYTRSALFFIGILVPFGLFLITYKGYKRDKTKEWLSDNVLTQIAGWAVIIVVLCPTSCIESGSKLVDNLCSCADKRPLFGHVNTWFGFIHLAAAGIFLFSLAWMSYSRFPRGLDLSLWSDQVKQWVYKFCAFVVWFSMGVILLNIIADDLLNKEINPRVTIVFETSAVIAIGISWLVKGRTVNHIREIKTTVCKYLYDNTDR